MTTIRTIVRGDSYASRRPLYTYTLANSEELSPLNLSGCTVRTTYRTSPAKVEEDPTDASAVWKGTLVISSSGVPTTSNGLVLKGTASSGVIEVHMSAEDTRTLPLNVELISDLEVTDAQGEVFTFLFDEKIIAIDGVTHRRTG